MSFYTTLHFYRPTPPPVITGPVLGRFLRALDATGLFERKGSESLRVRFGRSIDQDAKGTVIETPVRGLPGVSMLGSIEWDLDHDRVSLDDAVAVLANHDRPLYRASACIGHVRSDVIESLQTRRPDDGEVNLCLWDAGIHVGPIELGTLESESACAVGWMSVSFSGNGYLFPWTARVLTGRAAALPQLEPVVRACREAFPVDPNDPGPGFGKRGLFQRRERRLKARRRMGELWPFDDLDRPWDWYWGVAETG